MWHQWLLSCLGSATLALSAPRVASMAAVLPGHSYCAKIACIHRGAGGWRTNVATDGGGGVSRKAQNPKRDDPVKAVAASLPPASQSIVREQATATLSSSDSASEGGGSSSEEETTQQRGSVNEHLKV